LNSHLWGLHVGWDVIHPQLPMWSGYLPQFLSPAPAPSSSSARPARDGSASELCPPLLEVGRKPGWTTQATFTRSHMEGGNGVGQVFRAEGSLSVKFSAVSVCCDGCKENRGSSCGNQMAA